jgi:hypothetical protein
VKHFLADIDTNRSEGEVILSRCGCHGILPLSYRNSLIDPRIEPLKFFLAACSIDKRFSRNSLLAICPF